MKILSIETSCDETALAILEAKGGLNNPSFKIISEAINSQIKIHEKYGGVFPMMAKRAHAENIIPLLLKVLDKSKKEKVEVKLQKKEKIKKILEKEKGMYENFEKHIFRILKPKIDAIAVTVGPGLEPALWVGINFAKALGELWNIPVIPVNHMEGHITSVLINKTEEFKIKFPALALLISGGHTELVEIKKWGGYKILGKTRDDAIGEAFDKVARILRLPYPGGPEISRLAEKSRVESLKLKAESYKLPRPMIHSKDLDFSFSGIKTAVLYLVQKIESKGLKVNNKEIPEIAREFEEAVTEVLVSKTRKALEKTEAQTLIVAGGVSANKHIHKEMKKILKEFPNLDILFPSKKLTGDNAVMIGMAGYLSKFKNSNLKFKNIKAQGNLSF